MAVASMATAAQPPSLVDLPSPCLLIIMQHISSTNDYQSLSNAARSHSILHAAGVAALSSITLHALNQATVNNLLIYLTQYGRHVKHFSLSSREWSGVKLLRLPSNMQLESLFLDQIKLQFCGQGVLANQPALKGLKLHYCRIPDGADGLAAELQQLTGLEYLHVALPQVYWNEVFPFPGDVLPNLQHLTFLQLSQRATKNSTAYKHISSLTKLEALCLDPEDEDVITAKMLGPLSRLTSLRLRDYSDREAYLQPAALAGKSKLQHLQAHGMLFEGCWEVEGAAEAGTKALLSELQHLRELTYLDLQGTLQYSADVIPVAHYSALTASSKLQYLSLSHNQLPASVWQHVFTASRQLPFLQVLKLNGVSTHKVAKLGYHKWNEAIVARIVSCCPALRHLEALELLVAPEAIAALSQLSDLQHLWLSRVGAGCWTVFTQLRQLKHLDFGFGCGKPASAAVEQERAQASMGHLVQLAQLTQLTNLKVWGDICKTFKCETASDQPVWQQIQEYCSSAT